MDSNNIIMKESKFGIASIICMITAIVLVILGYILLWIALINFSDGVVMVGLFFILVSPLAVCAGIVTGIIGCCQSNCKKVTAIVGLSVNALFFLFIVIMISGTDLIDNLS